MVRDDDKGWGKGAVFSIRQTRRKQLLGQVYEYWYNK